MVDGEVNTLLKRRRLHNRRGVLIAETCTL